MRTSLSHSIHHFFPKQLFVFYCQIIILAKLPLTKWMKNKSHWKFKAQLYHVFIAVPVCLKYGLLTGCFKKNTTNNNKTKSTFGEKETIPKTFPSLLCLKGISETFRPGLKVGSI